MAASTEAVAASMMKLALDGAALRHQAIAANIANATTRGYVPVRVEFEQQLREARDRLEAGESVSSVAAGFAEATEPTPDADGAAVAVDLEVAQLAQNVVQYQALTRALSKRMSILAMAINEGKR
jgi:flagellar basal-body rod protein FlgB